MRTLPAERPRVPGAGQSSQGESGPKARPTGVVDGQRVDIPVPAKNRPNQDSNAKSLNTAYRSLRGERAGLALDPMLVRLTY